MSKYINFESSFIVRSFLTTAGAGTGSLFMTIFGGIHFVMTYEIKIL